MTIIKLREWKLIMDNELEKMTYDKVFNGSCQGCNYKDYKNFVSNREIIYPEEITKLLTEICINY